MPVKVFNSEDSALKTFASSSKNTALPPLKLKGNAKVDLVQNHSDMLLLTDHQSNINVDIIPDECDTPRTSQHRSIKSSKSLSHLFSYKNKDEQKNITTAKCSSHTDLTRDYSEKDLEIFQNAMRQLALNQNNTTESDNKPIFQLGDSVDSDEEELALEELENDLSTKLKSKLLNALKLESETSSLLHSSWPQIPNKVVHDEDEDNLDTRSVCSDSELLTHSFKHSGDEKLRATDLSSSSILSTPPMDSTGSSDVCFDNSNARPQAGAMPLLLSSQARERSFLVGGLTKHQSLLGSDELHRYFPDKRLGLFVGTWNMQRRGIPRNLEEFLIPKHEEVMMDMYVVGLQEATQDQDKWEIKLQKTLGPNYVLAHSVSHGVLHIAVLMRRDLIWFCSAFESDKVTTRMVSRIKTKGAVAISFQFFGTSMLFVSSHFRSGETRCKERIDDFNKISEKLQLPKRSKKGIVHTKKLTDRFDCVFWLGDLNFRISRPREIMQDEVNNPHEYDFNEVLKGDQLLAMMRKDRIFQGFTEPEITFLPTYKFNPGSNDYDVTKMRVPSYTDRILSKCKENSSLSCYRYKSVPAIRKSDHRPVYALFHVSLKPAKSNSVAAGGGQFRHDVYKKAVQLRANNLNHSQSTVCNIL